MWNRWSFYLKVFSQKLAKIGREKLSTKGFFLAGLTLWNQTRQRWIGNNKRPEKQTEQSREPKLRYTTLLD